MSVPKIVPSGPASLSVGGLHPDVTEHQLWNAFQEFSSLSSVKLCTDSTTGRSLCYGFVNLFSHQEAFQAIESKNHSSLNGKVIRVTWAHRHHLARKGDTSKWTVFVKNLDESIDDAGLHDLFQKYGNILSSKVEMSKDGKSTGCGFIQFESQESASAAIVELHESIVRDNQIYVPKDDEDDKGFESIYDDILDDAGQAMGATHRSQLEEFIGNLEASSQASEDHGLHVNRSSMNLHVARAQKKVQCDSEQRPHNQFEETRKEQILKHKGSDIYVKNIADGVSDEELRDHFSACGIITSAEVKRDNEGRSKGFGFVRFSNPEEANKAVNTFHGCMFHRKPLYVAIGQSKQDRRAQLQHYYEQQIAGLAGPSTGRYHSYFHAAGPFQQSPVPIVSNNTRQHRQNGGRMNERTNLQTNSPSSIYIPHIYATVPSTGEAKYVSSGHQQEMGKGSGISSPEGSQGSEMLHRMLATTITERQKQVLGEHLYPLIQKLKTEKGSGISSSEGSQGSEMLRSMLATTITEQQKQILGEHLYPLIQKLKPSLAARITGMFLEMDNRELLALLESPETLSAKVEEAEQVIEKTKVSAFHICPRLERLSMCPVDAPARDGKSINFTRE